MTNFKPYPEISIAEREDLSATWIVDNKGDVILIDTNGDTAALERMVQCWNACRKIAFPENHIPATDDYIQRLDQLRKDAVALGGDASNGWNKDIVSAMKNAPVILATKCGKVIRAYWLEREGRWAGLASSELPVAWMPWPSHPHPVSDLSLNIVTKHSEVA